MNENIKNDAINSLTKIQECLGVQGENGGTTFSDDKEYFSSQLEIKIADIRPFEDLDDEQVKNKLAFILKKSRENVEKNLTTVLHIFAIQYANVMLDRDFSTKEYKEIVSLAGVKDTLSEEIRKGVSIYKKVIEENPPKEVPLRNKPFENFEYKAIENNSEKRFNRIIFGAPGTGKSFKINGDKDKLAEQLNEFGGFERVTFHPNYSYAQFVGTYKPVSENSDIKYKYVEGPFMRLLTAALENAKDSNKNARKRYFLLIEEINRANVAAVFGDMFQLLDRNTDGVSDYEIQTSEDVRKYLASKLGGDGTEDKYKTLKLPNNFYIWATMNSADQGVMPMDAAFKRRWDFEYLGIDNGEFNEDGTENETFKSYVLPIPSAYDSNTRKVTAYKPVSWNKIRHAINNKLNDISGVNEDKLLGPYFISKSVLEKALEVTSSGNLDEMEKICSAFKSKVLMYLFEDVVKMSPGDLFSKTLFDENKPVHYSYICSKFNENGLDIFDKDFVKD